METTFKQKLWEQRQPLGFTILRIAIGWHFLWEGWIKLAHPAWTAKGYLIGSWGPVAPLFHWIAGLTIQDTPILSWFATQATAETQWMMAIIDFSVPWLLFLSGLGLILGWFTRTAIVLAMGMLLFFIVATPALEYTPNLPDIYNYRPNMPKDQELGWQQYYNSLQHAQWAGKHAIETEGSYFLISKNVVEFLALLALLTLDLRRLYGFDSAFHWRPQTTDETEKLGIPAVS